MRLTTLLTVLSIVQLTASEGGYAQSKKLSLHVKNVEVESVLKEIRAQSDFDFFYNAAMLKDLPTVNMKVRKATVTDILDEIIPGYLAYEIVDKTIIIKKNPNPPPVKPEVEQMPALDPVSGRITDQSGQALPGATILVKGTNDGTSTDADGNFTLDVANDAVLVISFVGYVTQEIAVNGRSVVDVQLVEDASLLEQIVVTGYGVQEKQDVTGAISSVSGEDFKNLPISGIDRALQGRMAGVQVVRNGGAPGASTAIRIRGTGTVNNSEPLYIVDGVPTQSIDGINQNDIQTIDVLKDASASAIYGTRAANGVVIITTRKGESGKLNLNIDMYAGFSKVTQTLDVLDAPTLAEIKRERYTNDGIPINPIWEDPQYQTQLTNWQDELFQTGKTQNVDVSISGGNENSSYLFALGYYNEQGIVDKSEADRFSLRINSDHKINKWLRVGENMTLSTRTSNGFNTLSAQNGLIWSAIRFHPGLPIKDADGNFSSNQISGEFGDINNPLFEVDINDADRRNTRLLGNVTTEITLTKELSIRANFGC